MFEPMSCVVVFMFISCVFLGSRCKSKLSVCGALYHSSDHGGWFLLVPQSRVVDAFFHWDIFSLLDVRESDGCYYLSSVLVLWLLGVVVYHDFLYVSYYMYLFMSPVYDAICNIK